jgi:ligand-binding sensor domain-containing protein
MPIRSLLFIFLALALTSKVSGQVAIGQWRDHFPYNKAIAVVTDDQSRAYCATRAAIFRYDPANGEIQRMTKVNLLSDVNISTLAWNTALQGLVVGYENGNLDLVVGEKRQNLSDIRRSSIIGDKGIYRITFEGTTAYLSCGFGIVVVDLVALEVRETWLIGPGGSQLQINDLVFHNDSIFAATENGLYAAWRNELNLAAFTNWTKRTDIPQPNGRFSAVASFGGRLLVNQRTAADEGDTLFLYNGAWQRFTELFGQRNQNWNVSADGQFVVVTHKYNVQVYNTSMVETNNYGGYGGAVGAFPAEAVRTINGYCWIADTQLGLVRSDNTALNFTPGGPTNVNAYRMDASGGALYVATGAVAGNWSNQFLKDGVHSYVDGDWRTTNKFNDGLYETGVNTFGGTVNDIMAVAVDPNDPDHVFVGSWDDGWLEFRGRQVETMYYATNSTLGYETTTGTTKVNVAGLDFDKDGNLWISNGNADAPISVRTSTGSWRAYDPGSVLANNNLLSDILAADNGLKWVLRPRSNGMLVFNDNGTITDPSDDQYKVLNTFEGQGELPSLDVFSVAQDKDNEIWIGTGKGVAVFYNPDAVFSGDNFDCQQILIEQDGNVQILLETEAVSAIVVDGANRKWLGTQSSGAYLVSDDGTEQVLHFTMENSPLPSNNVLSIAIDGITGEVYFGTDQGIMSYRSDANEGALDSDCASVFPNPVRETYSGPVAITGLVRDSDVRITDVAGNLVYRARSLGGQAIWPATNMNGERVSTGVYLIFASDDTGEFKCNTKVLVVR